MSRALKDALQKLENWVFRSSSRVDKIAKGGAPGTRAAPTQAGDNDKSIGLRLDFGEPYPREGKEYRRVNLQVNKGAADPTLKSLANKNSHQVHASAEISAEEAKANPKAAVKGLFTDLKDDLK